jgi:molecular chaperone GrpE
MKGTAMTEKKKKTTKPSSDDMVPATELAAMQVLLDEANANAKENFEGWQRERADFNNFKRRIEREAQQQSFDYKGNIIKKVLPVLDDLERAMKSCPREGENAAWTQGLELITRKLQTILQSEGIESIASAGDVFDPNLHEALTHEDSPDCQSGTIIEVIEQGYKIGDRVLRPARVRVAR